MLNVFCESRVKWRTTSSSVLSGSGRSARSIAFGKNSFSGGAAGRYRLARPAWPPSKISGGSDAGEGMRRDLPQGGDEVRDLRRGREFGRVHENAVGELRIEAAEIEAADDAV